jgi:sporulation protein YlmC with PRC-barrel domain
MKDIPLKAKVQCSDSPCGKSTNVILNQDTHQVTHVAIEDKKLPDNPTRLVPIDKVASSSHEQITLNCTRDEVSHMEPFVISQVIQATGTAYASGTSEYVVDDPGYDVVHMEQVPAGEMALAPGMKISASDHTVGKLDELVLDPQSGAVTHLHMREGHLWGKKDVAIPVADVDFTNGETIYLSIDKEAVMALPAVPVNRKGK